MSDMRDYQNLRGGYASGRSYTFKVNRHPNSKPPSSEPAKTKRVQAEARVLYEREEGWPRRWEMQVDVIATLDENGRVVDLEMLK